MGKPIYYMGKPYINRVIKVFVGILNGKVIGKFLLGGQIWKAKESQEAYCI